MCYLRVPISLYVVQVFYHLGELDDALTYALGAGQLFDINEQSEYVQTLLGAWGGLRLWWVQHRSTSKLQS